MLKNSLKFRSKRKLLAAKLGEQLVYKTLSLGLTRNDQSSDNVCKNSGTCEKYSENPSQTNDGGVYIKIFCKTAANATKLFVGFRSIKFSLHCYNSFVLINIVDFDYAKVEGIGTRVYRGLVFKAS